MEIRSDKDQIMVVDGALPPDLCDAIVAKYSQDERRTASLSKTKFDKPYREGLCLTISRHPDWKELDDQVFPRVKEAAELYLKRYDIDTALRDTGYTVADFEPGSVTREHVDHIHGNSVFRLVTMVFYLNEPAEGGETAFPYQGQEVKPRKGSVVMFPPFFTHRHCSRPASEHRYIMVTWLCSDPALYDPKLGIV